MADTAFGGMAPDADVSTTSARRPWAYPRSAALDSVVWRYSSAVATPVASMIGTITPATRTVPSRAFWAARYAAGPGTARIGQRRTATVGRVTPGARRANPIAQRITVGAAVLAAVGPFITVAVTMASAAPPTRHSNARISRAGVSHLRGTSVSPSASIGRARIAPRPATAPTVRAATRAVPAAAAAGIQPCRYSRACETTPCSAMRP